MSLEVWDIRSLPNRTWKCSAQVEHTRNWNFEANTSIVNGAADAKSLSDACFNVLIPNHLAMTAVVFWYRHLCFAFVSVSHK